ncbi:MAG: nucleoside deaminase [Spirochaetia bacterium]|nr:nucleoside deaminase [Spirochaetia bacterium]
MSSEYMNRAFQEAFKMANEAFEHNEVPVGSVILRDQTIIAAQRNRIIERKDPTAHAEILAIQDAANFMRNERLVDCELFTTLEPCAMCTGAIIMARIPRVYFLLLDEKLPGLRAVLSLPGHNHVPLWSHELRPDILSSELLKNFFRQRRS